MPLLLHWKGETVYALRSSVLMQGSQITEVVAACENFQGQLLQFLKSQHPENLQLAQDLKIVEEEVVTMNNNPETNYDRARRVEAEERVITLIVRSRASFGWRASQKVQQAVLMRLSSVRAIDRLDFLASAM